MLEFGKSVAASAVTVQQVGVCNVSQYLLDWGDTHTRLGEFSLRRRVHCEFYDDDLA